MAITTSQIDAELSGHGKAVESVCFAGAERPELFGSVSSEGVLVFWSTKHKNGYFLSSNDLLEPLKSLQTKSKNNIISFSPGDELVLVCYTVW